MTPLPPCISKRNPMPQITHKPGERWLLVGMTGTGKSTLLRALSQTLAAEYTHPEFVLDSKHDPIFTPDITSGYYRFVQSLHAPEIEPTLADRKLSERKKTIYTTLSKWGLLTPSTLRKTTRQTGPADESFHLLWRPEDDLRDEYDDYLQQLFRLRRPFVCTIDEVANLGGDSGQSFPQGLRLLLKQGRVFGETLIMGTQELAYQPRQIVGQATHLIRFRLRNEHDAGIIDRQVGTELSEPPDAHGFYYTRLDMDFPVYYYTGIDEFLSAE